MMDKAKVTGASPAPGKTEVDGGAPELSRIIAGPTGWRGSCLRLGNTPRHITSPTGRQRRASCSSEACWWRVW